MAQIEHQSSSSTTRGKTMRMPPSNLLLYYKRREFLTVDRNYRGKFSDKQKRGRKIFPSLEASKITILIFHPVLLVFIVQVRENSRWGVLQSCTVVERPANSEIVRGDSLEALRVKCYGRARKALPNIRGLLRQISVMVAYGGRAHSNFWNWRRKFFRGLS